MKHISCKKGHVLTKGLILFFIFFSPLSFAQLFNIQIGDSVKVSSDKGIRRTDGNTFEAIGNVVIINKEEAIYGENATLQMDTGQIDVQGNVRYVGPMMTMYGQTLNYNVKSKFLSVKQGKIIAQGYTVWGEYMAKVGPKKVIAHKAEYTTCLDCPESWTIYGDKVTLTLEEYIHIRPALIKSNGAPIFYSPYAVFPIKRGRQTGLLFPQFSFSLTKGIYYRQPFFWAISDNKDMTLTPAVSDLRGLSTEVEYRHILGESKWFEIDSFYGHDKVYLPGAGVNDKNLKRMEAERPKESGTHYKRYMFDYEHHYQYENSITHHFLFNGVRDFGLMKDYSSMMEKKIMGPELPTWGFVNGRLPLVDFNVEGSFNKSLLTPSYHEFDDDYVQTLPRMNLSVVPYSLYQSDKPFLQNISIGFDSTYTYFRQNRVKETPEVIGGENYTFIRNAERIEAYPYLAWTFGSLGPFTFKSEVTHELQSYHFPRNEKERSFRKTGSVITSEVFFEIDRIFSPAYKENVSVSKVEMREEEKVKEIPENQNLIGSLPEFGKYYIEDNVLIQKDSYRHSLYFNILHHYTADQNTYGSYRFYRQIKEDNGYGLFDDIDAPRDLRNTVGTTESATGISKRNTLELKIFNSVFRKRAKSSSAPPDGSYLKNNFSYSKWAYFNISQGLELNANKNIWNGEEHKPRYEKFERRLTRLGVSTGFPIKKWSLSFSDYYFYHVGKHVAVGSVSRPIPYGNFSFSYSYNSLPKEKNPDQSWTLSLKLRPVDTWGYAGYFSYDIKNHHYTSSSHSIVYIPHNNCWQASLGYSVKPEIVDGRQKSVPQIQFNFFVNFGEGRFVSILSPGEDFTNAGG